MKITSVAFIILTLSFLLNGCSEDPAVIPGSANKVVINNAEYSTVKIGTQTWTSSNYNGPGGLPFDATNSKPHYGKYYTKAELQQITLPEGWRIPTMNDYIKMAEASNVTVPSHGNDTEDIKSITATSAWKNVNGNNTSGFNAYPAGYIFGNSVPMDGDIAEFWTSEGYSLSIQEAGANMSLYRIVFYDNSNSPDFRYNVRFVKD